MARREYARFLLALREAREGKKEEKRSSFKSIPRHRARPSAAPRVATIIDESWPRAIRAGFREWQNNSFTANTVIPFYRGDINLLIDRANMKTSDNFRRIATIVAESRSFRAASARIIITGVFSIFLAT
jgi:hypothetical protein